jgi:hypothetical protein
MQLAHERISSNNGLTVLWLAFNRESGLPPEHWLNGIQSLHVQGKLPPHILENEWVISVEAALGLRFGLPGLSAALAEYIEKKTSGFVGRGHIFAEIQRYLAEKKSGYITLTGEPGIGKTAILCELTKRERAVAHFFIRTTGVTRISQMYECLGRQLHDRFGASAAADASQPWSVTFESWLTEAKAKLASGEKLIVVIDAADECEELAAGGASGNMLSLPRSLPSNVYCVISRRDLDPVRFNIQIETEPDVGNEELPLLKFIEDNARDIEAFLRAHFESQPDHPWLVRHKQSIEQAVKLFGEKSDGNFMYLRYILPQIADDPGDFLPRQLPKGLKEYYFGHWRRMTARWQDDAEAGLVFGAIYLMVVDHSLRTVRQVAGILGVSLQQVRVLIQQWREFLEEDSIGGETGYRIYHWSFAEFLEGQDPVVDAAVTVGPQRKRASAMIQNYIFRAIFKRAST